MKKPWSITTTLRSPKRLRNFLIVLKQIEGCNWNLDNQRKYQILLIKERVYGYGKTQFYNGLSQKQINLIDNPSKNISFKQAEAIFNAKNYEDPPMRGRQSINPLKKLGFVSIKDEKIFITDLGKLFLKDDFDFGDIVFRSFLKWQIPNPDSRDYTNKDDYNIKPFIGVLHLIQKVNEKALKNKEKAKGISKQEFSLFCPTLVDYEQINSYADKIISLRKKLKGKNKQEQKELFDKYKASFVKDFLNTDDSNEINRLINNLKDYGDNAIRYFRLTRYIYIRGGGFYVDLEPRRSVEINNLLLHDNAQSADFESKQDYLDFISDIRQPKLPWETKEKYIEIIEQLLIEIKEYENTLEKKSQQIPKYETFDEEKLQKYIKQLREYRRTLQEKIDQQNSQSIEQINIYIEKLKNIYELENRPIMLEKFSTLALNALNDALKIKPNYPVGDDNEPTFTAPANTPDIECFYKKYNAICEVTMLTSRDQFYNEGQPVMRHLRDFEDKYPEKKAYCLFIAPRLHIDTVETFLNSTSGRGYRGKKQKIVPLSINNFIELLEILVSLKQKERFLKHEELFSLYDEILEASKSYNDSMKWVENIPKTINSWKENIFNL